MKHTNIYMGNEQNINNNFKKIVPGEKSIRSVSEMNRAGNRERICNIQQNQTTTKAK